MAGKGKITVFISTYESRKYVAMILNVQKLAATYIIEFNSSYPSWPDSRT
jgi:general stress protein CsbA